MKLYRECSAHQKTHFCRRKNWRMGSVELQSHQGKFQLEEEEIHRVGSLTKRWYCHLQRRASDLGTPSFIKRVRWDTALFQQKGKQAHQFLELSQVKISPQPWNRPEVPMDQLHLWSHKKVQHRGRAQWNQNNPPLIQYHPRTWMKRPSATPNPMAQDSNQRISLIHWPSSKR